MECSRWPLARTVVGLEVVGLAVVGLVGGGLLGIAGEAVAGPLAAPDPDALVARAREVQQADLMAWGALVFQRRVERERLDAADRVQERHRLEFEVVPRGDGRFDEELRLVDGRLASRSEVREHRRARRFEKRYRTAYSGDAGDFEKGDFSLTQFMTRPTYRYRGVEVVDGVRCHRLEFPAEAEPDAGVASRVSAATEGILWLETTTLHAIRAESRLVRPVSALAGLLRVERVEVEMTTLSHGAHRLPSVIEVTTTSVIAGKTQRKRNRFRYSGHRPGGGD